MLRAEADTSRGESTIIIVLLDYMSPSLKQAHGIAHQLGRLLTFCTTTTTAICQPCHD
jgi:hypothetical protein